MNLVDDLLKFRFADRIDLLLMIVAICFIGLEMICRIAILFFFGQLTGLFAAESSAAICGSLNNLTCLLGI